METPGIFESIYLVWQCRALHWPMYISSINSQPFASLVLVAYEWQWQSHWSFKASANDQFICIIVGHETIQAATSRAKGMSLGFKACGKRQSVQMMLVALKITGGQTSRSSLTHWNTILFCLHCIEQRVWIRQFIVFSVSFCLFLWHLCV